MPPLGYENDIAGGWGAAPAAAARAQPAEQVSVESTLAKERIIKEIIQMRDGLRGLLVRVTEVEGETDKLRKDNEFLGTYIDNLTRNTVVAAGQNQKR